MLLIGPQLYELTPRDRATLFLDPKNLRLSDTIAAASTSSIQFIPLPPDRAFYCHHIAAQVVPAVASDCDNIAISWQASNVSLGSLVDDTNYLLHFQQAFPPASVMRYDGQQAGVAAGGGVVNVSPKVVLPPGGFLKCAYSRVGTANPQVVITRVWGWLMPAANVGRAS